MQQPTFERRHPMFLAIAATFCAAALVLFLQHRALSALDAQTRVILQQIGQQTATDVATEIRRILNGPVFDTLTAVNHPELQAGRLDLVLNEYEEGLRSYPQVDRFFAWNAETNETAPNEVMFYGRDRKGLVRDPELGKAIIEIARRYAPAQQIYIAAEGVGPDKRLQVFVRLFWTDAHRVEYFAALGFVVDPSVLRQRLVPALYESRLAGLLERRDDDLPLELRVTDERGALVFGNATDLPLTAHVELPMLFYPPEIEPRLAAGIEAHPWCVEVSTRPQSGMLGGISQSYLPTVLSVMLMLVALALTVQAHRRAAELARMQAEFISHVSHHLKTPLSLLSAATETMSMDRVRTPEKLAQYVGIIRGEVTRLSSLVQRILEFSRMHQAQGYEFERVDLAKLVRETVESFESSLAGRHFTFRVEHDGSPIHVSADTAALEQVLANLLDNAVKYSGAVREVVVRVKTCGSSACIDVIDRGVGIAAVDREQIFEKFYRGSSVAHHRDGVGLGLPIVRELVLAHHGRIEVESEPGLGSMFRVVLPMLKPEPVIAAGGLDEAPAKWETTT